MSGQRPFARFLVILLILFPLSPRQASGPDGRRANSPPVLSAQAALRLAGPFLPADLQNSPSFTQAITSTTVLPLVVRGYHRPVDSDGDGLPDLYEDLNGNGVVEPELGETDPFDPDCDDDGLGDGQEVMAYGCSPWSVESDGDGLGDYVEIGTTHTNPAQADTDADALDDSAEDLDADGTVDPGETDPDRADTDADGLTDGEERVSGDDGYVTDPRLPDTDDDSLSDGDEAAAGTDPTQADGDGDTLDDPEEIAPGADAAVTDPLAADSDGDGLDDGAEASAGSNPLTADSDADGLADYAEVALYGSSPLLPDTDADSLPDYTEVITTTTNPADSDTDGDTLPDAWEVQYGLNPLLDDAAADLDGDGQSNAEEHAAGTDPARPDSDEDGLPDGAEVISGTNPLDLDSDDDSLADGIEVLAGAGPLDADSDDDGLLDGLESGWNADLDGDGLISALDPDADDDTLPDAAEDADLDGVLDPGETSPGEADTDDDGMPDAWELDQGFDPRDPIDRDGDPDADGLLNRLEFVAGADPHDADSDADGLMDGLEAGLGLDPTDPGDAAGDLDADYVANLDEYLAGTGLDVPDSDGDTIVDGQEPGWNQDTDGDGLLNALDPDSDADGLNDGIEVFDTLTNPLDPDTDGDGPSDGAEVLTYLTDPLNPDSDHDGAPDGAELAGGTDPLDADSDDDTLEDGDELVDGWNGYTSEAESLGAAATDPVYGNLSAQRGATSTILTWTLEEVPPGSYRVAFRARAPDNPGDVASLTVLAGGQVLSQDFPLLDAIYRWQSGDAFSLAVTGSVVITLTDPQTPPTVLIDRVMVAARDAEPVYYTNWATLNDTDGDGLRDGLETAHDSFWLEAEHYPAAAGLVVDEVEASSSKMLRNTQPNQVLAIVPEGHTLGPLADPPPWSYQVFVRARRDPALDPNADVQVAVRLPSRPQPFTGTLLHLTDRLEWQPVLSLLQVMPGDTLRITVTAQTVAGQAVEVDKLLIAPIWFEGMSGNAPCCDPIGGNGEMIHADPRPPIMVIDDDGNMPDLLAYYTGPLNTLGWSYIVWDVAGQGEPGPADLEDHQLVIWFTGRTGSSTFTAANEAAVAPYLESGGRLFLSSAGYLSERGLTPFNQIYLHVATFSSNVNQLNLMGNPADPIGGGFGPYALTPPTGWSGSLGTDMAEPDTLPGASYPFAYQFSTLRAGTDYDGAAYKTVFFPWPFEGLADMGVRTALLERIATWAGVGANDVDAAVPILQDQPAGFTDPLDQDTDGDGYRAFDGFLPGSAGYLTDQHEQVIGTNPFDIDTDSDADLYPADDILDDYGGPDTNSDCKPEGGPDGHPDWTDDADCNPLSMDADDDEVLDWNDPLPGDYDIDNDGLKDGGEDTNLDGVWTQPEETWLGTVATQTQECPLNLALDTDSDGLTDGLEQGVDEAPGPLTDPQCFKADQDTGTTTNPLAADTDGDGLWDGPTDPGSPPGYSGEDENANGMVDAGETNPRRPDSDYDELIDGQEVGRTDDTDGDGLINALDPDSDGDWLTDGEEVLEVGSSPVMTDTDGDGFEDGFEAGYPGYAANAALHPPIVNPGRVYLYDPDGDAGWVKVGETLISTGTVLIGGQQSGGGRRLNAAAWRRAAARLANANVYTVEINGQVVVDEASGSIAGSGTVDVLIPVEPEQRIRIMDGTFSLDSESGTLAGEVCASAAVGDYGLVTLSGMADADVTVDARTGKIAGVGRVSLTPPLGAAVILEGEFSVEPAAFKLSFAVEDDRAISLIAGSLPIALGGAEAAIDLTNGSFAGKAYIEIPNVGPIVTTGPKAEFSLDAPRGHLRFSVESSLQTTIYLGAISLELGQAEPGFAFEIDAGTGYFYLQISNIDLGEASINDVEIEIDPGGGIEFEPRYTVPGYLDGQFSGHLRFAGDVSVLIPIPREPPTCRPQAALPPGEAPCDYTWPGKSPVEVGLMLNVQGEHVIRIPGDDEFLWATNASLGIELSAGVATLGLEIGGTTSIFSLGGDDPLLAIGVGQDGMALKDLQLGLPDALGNFYPLPGETAVFVYYLERQRLEGAARYNNLGLELGAEFALDVAHGLAVTGTLDIPLAGTEIDLAGLIDWDGNMLLTGQADVTWFGWSLADAWFTLDNDGLAVSGTVAIPGVGSALVHGSISADGTFSFSGGADLSPGGWTIASASINWTNAALQFSGAITTDIVDVSVSGSATSGGFHLEGSGDLAVGGFTLASADVTLDSTTGLYAQGSVHVPNAGWASLSGTLEPDGSVSLSGSGSLAPGGFTLATASFDLAGGPGWAAFTASGTLQLGDTSIAGASFAISSDGSLTGSGWVSWGGLDLTASVSVSSGGAVSLSGSIDIDATYNGYGIVGSLYLAASSSGQVSASMDFQAEIGGETVFSGSASVSSSGKATFRACLLICVSVTIYL